MCEKNHTEIRKIIPKRNKIDFDEFDNFDIAYINSHINSQPRKSLGGHSPIQLFKKMFGAIAKEFLNLFGIQEIPKEKLNLTYEGFKKDISDLESSISELKSQNDSKEYDLNCSVDLNYIVQVATGEMGMVRSSSGQIRTYNSSASEYVQQVAEIPTE